MGLFDWFKRRRSSTTSSRIEQAMVYALSTTTGSGPNDLLVGVDGKQYWVSTLRYPAGHWQTGVFDRADPQHLIHPAFLINELVHPADALQNHLTTLILIAEFPTSDWPTGMHTEPCTDPAWLQAREKVRMKILSTTDGPIETYAVLRESLNCAHL